MEPARFARRPSLARLFAYFAGAVLVWRSTLFGFAYVARLTIPERGINNNKDFVAFPDNLLLDSFARWDAVWYWRIARGGYAIDGVQNNVAFLPGFPLLARVGAVFTDNLWSAGLWVSNLSLLAAVFFVYGIARRYFDESDARRSALLVLVFPTSLFFSAFYSEGLFLLTVASTLYFYERDQLLAASLCGCAAAFTRSTGVLLFPALLLGVLHRGDYHLRKLSPRALYLLLIPAGTGLVAYMQYRAVGDPLAFVHAQTAWGRSSTWPLSTLTREALAIGRQPDGVQAAFDCAAAFGMFAVVAGSLHTLDLAHSVFAALSVLVPLSSGSVLSMERFAACVVPMYLVLTRATRSPDLERYVIYLATLGLALRTILYANWFFAG
jgi:hypothetical protein